MPTVAYEQHNLGLECRRTRLCSSFPFHGESPFYQCLHRYEQYKLFWNAGKLFSHHCDINFMVHVKVQLLLMLTRRYEQDAAYMLHLECRKIVFASYLHVYKGWVVKKGKNGCIPGKNSHGAQYLVSLMDEPSPIENIVIWCVNIPSYIFLTTQPLSWYKLNFLFMPAQLIVTWLSKHQYMNMNMQHMLGLECKSEQGKR
jgi:hypothetical protein